ncbi:OmpP1/FadL family transporter [Vibrio sinaloensis]|uniref:OmpP1/FadL family transporter n=1 Tax=Photobacterium sp. (strain ATCC 43367) TaxID=379097 RepID=UPI002047E54C|nr:outer membrane protein transport protein [Vibrio sinaloensis]UPQ88977.1 outer membrane protein transport protein [Vibrio sinaloensis]
MSLIQPKLSALTLAIFSCHSYAAATLVSEMSQLNVGTAGAGSAVLAEDASVAYSNPAAMAYLDQTHIAVNMATMALSIEYQDERDSRLSSANAGGVQPYGSLYAVSPINDHYHVGVSLVATGGSGLDYGTDYAGKLGLNDLQLSVMQFNPSLSYKLNERLTLGAGFQIDRATFEQRFLSERATLESTSYAFGYNFGATYLHSEHHRFGVTYRSKMEHDLEGELTLFNRQLDTRVDLVNAAKLEVSGYHQLNHPIAFVWSIGKEFWSANDVTAIYVKDMDVTKKRGFDDVWFASIGSKIAVNDKFTMDVGFGYVESPLDQASLQSPDLPVDKQIKYSLGGRYQWNRSTNLSLYYSYADYGSPEIQNGAMQGRYNNSNHFLGITLDYKY